MPNRRRLPLHPPGAPGGAAFGIKGFLEIGLRIGGPIPIGSALQNTRLGHGTLRRLEIMGVVGGEAKFTAGFQGKGEIVDEAGLKEAPRPVAAFGPWIRKKNISDGDAARRQEITDSVAGFEAKDAQVGQSRADGAFLDLADAAQETFDGQEIDARMLLRVSKRKAAIARAEIQFNRLVIAEERPPVETGAEVGDFDPAV